MSEFMGINGHTVQFRAELYAKVCRKVRDYHSLEWDLGKETDFVPRFPEARNRVNWNQVYESWQKAGFETDVCVMFNNTPPNSWKDMDRDARNYGRAFAKAFGPSSEKRLLSSVEIGNEPGNYSDEQYRTVFRAMAEGLREGDAKLQIATCNITAGKSGRYEKSVECVAGFDKLYDVLTTHSYAMAEGWPTWRRSYPEDPKIEFLKSIERVIEWRDKHAHGKPIWVTEFGWDASTKPKKSTGDFAKWEGNVSDERQAEYLVRTMLVLSAMEVERGYLYFFNDANEPSFHAASGITRDFKPKASYYALAHLYRTLGDYKFDKALLKKEADVYAYQFVHRDDAKRKIIVAWSPTGSDRKGEATLPGLGGKVTRVEVMPIDDGAAKDVGAEIVQSEDASGMKIAVSERPVYIAVGE